ncbi:MAG TPA: ribosome silencing factor [Baekduia sp.]|nr:ribosome silencing factor [Baekduia sp.]
MSESEMTSEEMAVAVAGYAADKKAIDLAVLDLRGVAAYTDFFIVCSGGSDRQVKAIHDGIHLGMKNEHGQIPTRVEGMPQASWVVMDYSDVVVHAFTPDMRDFYRLEQLWGEVPRLALPEPAVS